MSRRKWHTHPEMPARRILDNLYQGRGWGLGPLMDRVVYGSTTDQRTNALDALCDAGLCDE